MTDWASHPEYDDLIVRHRTADRTYVDIATSLSVEFGIDVSADQVSGRYSRIKTAGPAPSPEERFAAQVQKERSQAEDRALAREMSVAVRAAARWAEFMDVVTGQLVLSEPVITPPLVIPQGSGTPEEMGVVVADPHIGKFVRTEDVGAGFGYGLPVFGDRFAVLKRQVLSLFTLHSANAPVTKIRIYFLGDGVDGTDMRRGHSARVDVRTGMEQVLILVREFELWLRELAQLGIRIEVIWEFGNHGRVGEFGVNLPADNYDFIAGQILTVAVRDLENVRVFAETTKYTITDFGPMRVYSTHGDSINGGHGFSGIPIDSMARAISKDTGLHRQLFDLYLTAHFHTPQNIQTSSGRIIQSGSWDGGDDYSINRLKVASDPVQYAFGVHPRRGITWENRVDLVQERRGPTPALDTEAPR